MNYITMPIRMTLCGKFGIAPMFTAPVWEQIMMVNPDETYPQRTILSVKVLAPSSIGGCQRSCNSYFCSYLLLNVGRTTWKLLCNTFLIYSITRTNLQRNYIPMKKTK